MKFVFLKKRLAQNNNCDNPGQTNQIGSGCGLVASLRDWILIVI